MFNSSSSLKVTMHNTTSNDIPNVLILSFAHLGNKNDMYSCALFFHDVDTYGNHKTKVHHHYALENIYEDLNNASIITTTLGQGKITINCSKGKDMLPITVYKDTCLPQSLEHVSTSSFNKIVG